MNLEQNTYIYLLVAALTIYAIRALPLTLIKKEITNTFIRSFLYYVPFVTLAVMAFPAIVTATSSPVSGIVAFVVAVVVAWVDGNLFKVALASCVAVYVTELIVL
jgi:branched-subunit amino acid transport protein